MRIIIAFLIFFSPSIIFAGIDVPWSTTFDCDEWVYTDGALNCDGIDPGGGWTCSDTSEHYEQITTTANMGTGGGGRGQRFWQGDGENNNSGGLSVEFNSTQSEFWFRFYMRYQEGYKKRIDSVGDKIIYPNGSQWFQFYQFDYIQLVSSYPGGDSYRSASGKGWDNINSAGEDSVDGHKLSDGQWHLYEIHLKMDTNGSNGEFHCWVDEELVVSRTDCAFGTREGWTDVLIGSNQKYPDNGQCETVDFDDIAVSNTGYIGPLSTIPTITIITGIEIR